jgi:hypothetical protein
MQRINTIDCVVLLSGFVTLLLRVALELTPHDAVMERDTYRSRTELEEHEGAIDAHLDPVERRAQYIASRKQPR